MMEMVLSFCLLIQREWVEVGDVSTLAKLHHLYTEVYESFESDTRLRLRLTNHKKDAGTIR